MAKVAVRAELVDGMPVAVQEVSDPDLTVYVLIPEAEVDSFNANDWVWNAATGRLRPVTAADRLRLAKLRKHTEIEQGYGSAQARRFQNPYVMRVMEKTTPQDPRVQLLNNDDQRFDTLKKQIDNVQTDTLAKVDAIKW